MWVIRGFRIKEMVTVELIPDIADQELSEMRKKIFQK